MTKPSIRIKRVSKGIPNQTDDVHSYTIRFRGETLIADSRVVGDRAQAKREAHYAADSLGFTDGIDF